MKLGDYKLIFVAMGLIGVLLIASPAIAGAIHAPAGEAFSELYLLGPDLMAQNYPSNIVVGQNYSVYVAVGNHLGSLAYYEVYVKLANATDPMPNATLATPSLLEPLYDYRFTISDNTVWQNLLTFKVTDATTTQSSATMNTLQINNQTINIDKTTNWNTNTTTYTYRLLIELWLYNQQTATTQFNNRYVDLQLNLTQTP